MAWLSMSLRVLAAVVAVVVVETEIQRVAEAGHRADDNQEQETETFVLSSDVHSQLFSHCMDEKNTVEGSMYSIQVDGEIKYVRFDASGNDRNILWETESDVASTVGCAFRAHERGALMFKFTRAAGCQLALDNAYDRSQPSCEGSEIVYVINMNLCLTDDKAYREGETINDFCPKICTEERIIYADPRIQGPPYGIQSRECCEVGRTSNGKCGFRANVPFTMCQNDDLCTSNGLVIYPLVDADDVEYLFSLLESEGDSTSVFWVGVYKDDSGVWRHMVNDELVDSALWGLGEPSDAGRCAVATHERSITAVACTANSSIWCTVPSTDLPGCPDDE